MKRIILYAILSFCILLNCGKCTNTSNNTITTTTSYSTGSLKKMELVENRTFNMSQIDSVILADSLMVFNEWHKNTLYDAESGTPIEQRMFLKCINDSTVMAYSTTYSNNTNSKYVFKKIKYLTNEK